MAFIKFFIRSFILFALLILVFLSEIQCRRTGGGGSRSSSSGSYSRGSSNRGNSNGGYRGGSSGGYHGSSGGYQTSGGGYHASSGGYHGTSGGNQQSSSAGAHRGSSGTDFYRQNTAGRQQTSTSNRGGSDFYHTNTNSRTNTQQQSGSRPGNIGFERINQQVAANRGTGGSNTGTIHSTNINPSNSAKPFNPSAPPGYSVQGGTGYIASGNRPGGLGFENANRQQSAVHSTNVNQLNSAKPFNPSAPPGYTVQGGTGYASNPIGNTGIHKTNVNPVGSTQPGGTGTNLNNNRKPGDIGFDHLNRQAGQNTQHTGVGAGAGAGAYNPGGINKQNTYTQHGAYYPNTHQTSYQPYHPQTYTQPGSSYVHYQPPTQLQYQPPVIQSTSHHHYIPVYQPVYTQRSSSGIGGGSLLGYGGSFLGGYLIGKLSGSSYGGFGGGYGGFGSGYGGYGGGYGGGGYGGHTTYNTYNNYGNSDRPNDGVRNNDNDRPSYNDNDKGSNQNIYYTVHHYNYNQDKVPPQFSIPGESVKECTENTTSNLCAPNTNAFCLNNGTIMCVTPTSLTSPCQANATDKCVYTKIDCTGHPECPANQTYVEFYVPCISKVSYQDNKILDSTVQAQNNTANYELCVTAIANPRKLESPVGPTVALLTELGNWHVQKLSELNNNSTSAAA